MWYFVAVFVAGFAAGWAFFKHLQYLKDQAAAEAANLRSSIKSKL